jgi:positive regulator of sigma E activity|tara:strand:+ start:511 stop:1089 length:579 start_codon:yes stop_codon:yes gene_type:complete
MKHIWLILFVINSLWGQSFLSKIFPYKDHTLVFSENEKEHQLQVGSFVIIGLKSGDILENKYTGFSITKRKLRMSGLFFNHISLDEIQYVKVGTRPKYLKSRLIGAFSGYALSFILMDDYDTRREKAQASSGGQQVWLLPNSFIRFVFYVPIGIAGGSFYAENYTVKYSDKIELRSPIINDDGLYISISNSK